MGWGLQVHAAGHKSRGKAGRPGNLQLRGGRACCWNESRIVGCAQKQERSGAGCSSRNGAEGGRVSADERQEGMTAGEAVALFDRSRLRTARELRGLSQVGLAAQAGSLKPASLSQFENGHARPAAVTLQRLAGALRVPVGFFATPARVTLAGDVEGFFRSLRSTAPRDRRRALAHVKLAREFIQQLEKFVALPELNLPRSEQPVTEQSSREEIEALAEKVRQSWKIPSGPVGNVVRELERHGIATLRFRTELDRVDAFSVLFPDRPIVVLGADKSRRDRSRFDAAHELGHLVMHDLGSAGDRTIERQAHQFASAFLMPEGDIRDELPSKADWSHLLALKAKWHVSIAALLMRAKTLRVMDEKTYTQALKVMSVRGWRKSEPGDLGPPESPVLLWRAAKLLNENNQTFEGLVQGAELPEEDVRLIFSGDRTLPRVEV